MPRQPASAGAHLAGPLQAQSVSRSVQFSLHEGLFQARVQACFARACHLVTPDANVVALVIPEIGDGPLNIVVDGLDRSQALAGSAVSESIRPGMLATLESDLLQVGKVAIALDRAEVWEPCPDWEALWARRRLIEANLPLLQTLALSCAPEGSLLTLTCPGAGVTEATLTAVLEAAENLRAGWNGDEAQLQTGIAQVAGLGGGLTPAGDDFLVGAMLWVWLAHPVPSSWCQRVFEQAAPRTTTLSAALLRAAAAGECSAAWQHLLATLQGGTPDQLAPAIQAVLSHGNTSGADTLAGFLWMGLG